MQEQPAGEEAGVEKHRSPTDKDEGQNIVRGGLLLMVSKLVHIFAGFGLYFLLVKLFTRTLGDTAGVAAFGTWGAVLSIINPLNMMFVMGTQQAVSHFVAPRMKSGGGTTFWLCAQAQLVLVIVSFVAFAALAPQISEWRLGDPSYSGYLRVGALIFVFYAGKSLYQGYLNGARRFAHQAWLDIASSLLRMTLVLGAVAAGFGVAGGLQGFVASAAIVTIVAAIWIRPRRREGEERPALPSIWAFQAKVMGMVLLINFLMSVDLQAVTAYSSGDDIARQRYAGYYTAAQKLAQIPYSLIMALTVVIFPLIAREASNPDREVPAQIIRQGMRAMLLLLVPCSVILSATASESISLVFPGLMRAAIEAGDPASVVVLPLSILALAYGAFSLFMMSTTIITAGGQPGLSLSIVAVTLVIGDRLAVHLTHTMGAHGAALGVSVAWVLGVLACGVVIWRRYGSFVSPLSAARILGAGLIVYFVADFVPGTGIAVFAKDLTLGVLFGVLILLSFEVSMLEFKRVLGALPGPWSARK